MDIQPQADGSYRVPLSPIHASWRTPITPEMIETLNARSTLRGELCHPQPSAEGLATTEAIRDRYLNVREERVSHAISDLEMVDGWVVGTVRPAGPHGPRLQAMIDDPTCDVRFGFRSFSNVVGDTQELLLIVTWDLIAGERRL